MGDTEARDSGVEAGRVRPPRAVEPLILGGFIVLAGCSLHLDAGSVCSASGPLNYVQL